MYFGFGCEPPSLVGKLAMLAEDTELPPKALSTAVSTMLRPLSYFTICLIKSEEKAMQVLKSALRLGLDTALLMKEVTEAEERLVKDKSWFGETAGSGFVK